MWSSPVDDLRDWRYEGVSYLRTQDPSNANDIYQLWAPDAAQGKDGRYYLYYCLSGMQEIGVAVSDKPAGPFAFYGHVHYADGRTLTEMDFVAALDAATGESWEAFLTDWLFNVDDYADQTMFWYE